MEGITNEEYNYSNCNFRLMDNCEGCLLLLLV